MSTFAWPERECAICGAVKKEKPDHFRMKMNGGTGAITYAAACIPCEDRERKKQRQREYESKKARQAAHTLAVRERKESGQTYEDLLEQMERVHGPSAKWPAVLHMELSGELYRQGNVTRYLAQPEVLPADEQVELRVDYGSPLFRPSKKAIEALHGERR